MLVMSLRYASRVMYQAGTKAAQLMKDQLSKALRDSSASNSSSSKKKARLFSGALDHHQNINNSSAAKTDRLKQAEESLRTVMYLSCWGPN